MSDFNRVDPSESLTFLVTISDDIEEDAAEKGIFGRSALQPPSLKTIPITVLQENLAATLDGLRKLFPAKSYDDTSLVLKEVQVSFEVTATGKIALLGTSAELAGRGAITIILGS
jgi:hypothetical protein